MQQYEKKIEFYLGHAPTFNIIPNSTSAAVSALSPGITTNLPLFGVVMPNSNIQFQLSSFTIDNINTNWIWEDGTNLMEFKLTYNDGSNFVSLDNTDVDWNNPVKTQQSNTFLGSELVGPNDSFRTTYSYSRNGGEGD